MPETRRSWFGLEKCDERLVDLFSEDKPFAETFKCLFEDASDAIYRKDELLGVNLRKLVDKEGFKEIERQTETRKKGKVSRYELVMYSRDGKAQIVQVSASPLWNEKGKLVGALAILMDITERRQTEKALRESEEKFREIFENANDCLIYLDRSGRILDFNEKAVQVFGGSKEELLRKHFTRVGVLSLKDVPKLLGVFTKILRG